MSTSGGSSSCERGADSCSSGHRVQKRQPDGGASGDGMSPFSTTRVRVRCTTGSGTTAADRSACVYGCFGAENKSAVGAVSTIWPRYITATLSHRYSTVARSCVMNRHEKPRGGLRPPPGGG